MNGSRFRRAGGKVRQVASTTAMIANVAASTPSAAETPNALTSSAAERGSADARDREPDVEQPVALAQQPAGCRTAFTAPRATGREP